MAVCTQYKYHNQLCTVSNLLFMDLNTDLYISNHRPILGCVSVVMWLEDQLVEQGVNVCR